VHRERRDRQTSAQLVEVPVALLGVSFANPRVGGRRALALRRRRTAVLGTRRGGAAANSDEVGSDGEGEGARREREREKRQRERERQRRS
jgi:hypothetical protein